eukprot:498770-Heterocapsa_arctica.AAC.1
MDRSSLEGFWGSCEPSISPPPLPEPKLQLCVARKWATFRSTHVHMEGSIPRGIPGNPVGGHCKWIL